MALPMVQSTLSVGRGQKRSREQAEELGDPCR